MWRGCAHSVPVQMWAGVSPLSPGADVGGGEPTVLVLVELVEERPYAAVEREAVAHRAQRDHERLVEDALRGQPSAPLVLLWLLSAPAPLAVITTTESEMITDCDRFRLLLLSPLLLLSLWS